MNILIGISGGISSYKIPNLVSSLVKEKHNVKVILTENAKEFVSPLVLKTLSKNKVYDSLFADDVEIPHIDLVSWADLFILAPASANILAKFSNGIADDLLSSTFVANDKPIIVYPSMNTKMYENKITQDNVKKLRKFNYMVFEPSVGNLACGMNGKGRLPEPALIHELSLSYYEKLKTKQSFKNKKVLLTLGSTKAHIDSVRYIENASSGKMGYSILKELWKKGASVDVFCNKKTLNNFPYINLYSNNINVVETTKEAYEKIFKLFKDTDIYISSAAYCDFESSKINEKIKKKDFKTALNLEKAIDIFSNLSNKKTKQFMLGFSLETSNLKENALTKMKTKNMDLVVANKVNTIGKDCSSFTILDKKGKEKKFKDITKNEFAKYLINELEAYL
jgi:phosphopantothenoylcysteine decarboxylase / phosphopantothenate---cysteine ligase